METFAMYLFKSAIWLLGFALIYFLFLRNERFFQLKRFYLLSGVLISLFFPLISVHYQVEMSVPVMNNTNFIPVENTISASFHELSPDNQFGFRQILFLLYLSGVLYLTFRLAWRLRTFKLCFY
jgi:bla regulator protein blaR1